MSRPQYPDLNPIEHLQNHLKMKLADYDMRSPLTGFSNFGREYKRNGVK